MSEFFSQFLKPEVLFVILNLILIESLLSVDNAAVLATMVMDLPADQRKKALRIGLLFAYLFRGAALVFASVLIKINWLKLVGGGYLLYLCAHFFYKRLFKKEHIMAIEDEELGAAIKHPRTIPGLNHFWSTVVMVELMDLTFSLDNVFAAVAFTDNIYLVCTGVFIGIITMRIVAGYFVKLMEKFPFLDTIAFLIIGILGARLCLDFVCIQLEKGHVDSGLFFTICKGMESEHADLYFSLTTVVLFILPILSSLLFNFPKKNKKQP